MKLISRFSLFLLMLGIIAPVYRTSAADKKIPPVSYHSAGEIPMGGEGGWDDLSADPAGHRLFISHSDRVVVVDTQEKKVIREITGTSGVHAIALALPLGKAFSSNGKEGTVGVIDLVSLTIKQKIKVEENPDAIVYEPKHQHVYAFNGRSKSVSIIDAKEEKVLRTVSLPGKPEFAVVDPDLHRIFVNIEDKNSILAFDTDTQAIAATWPLENCESPSGIAIDVKNHRLFSVCENEKMVMVDSVLGKTLASVPTGKGTDGAAFDPVSMLAFSPNGKSGTLTVVKEETPERMVVVENLKTQLGARTMTIDPSTHRIYLPTAEFATAEKGARPKPVKGTQKILVYEP